MHKKIEEFTAYLKNEKQKSDNTILAYRHDLIRLKEYFEHKGLLSIRNITESDLAEYVRSLRSGELKNATVSRSVASMKAFFRFLSDRGELREDIAENLKAPRIEKKLPMILTEEEISRLLKQPDTSTLKGLRDKSMLELLYATGIRVTELISLKVEDLDFKTDHLHCHEKGRDRMIPFGGEARRALLVYLEKAREELAGSSAGNLLFINLNGSAMSRQGFWKILKTYGEKAEIKKAITPYTLRHSFAVHLIENGADLKSVQKMMGHSTISSTSYYTRFSDNAERTQYENSHPREKENRQET